VKDFRIFREYDKYNVFHFDVFSFSAIRKGGFFWGNKVYFYDHESNIIAHSEQTYFLMFDFGHKITFIEENIICKLKRVKSSYILNYKGSIYEIKNGLFRRKPELYINNEVCGFWKSISSSLGKFERSVSCENEKDGFLFAIMEIILDWFDVD